MLRSIFIMFLLTPAALSHASNAYRYEAPDGTVIFTDKELGAPYLLISSLELDWGRVAARPIVLQQSPFAARPRALDQSAMQNPIEQPAALVLPHRQFSEIVHDKALQYGLPAELIHAVIEAESAYDRLAVSHAGAEGLMQLMPLTAERLGVTDSFDAEQNIDGGSRYLRQLLNLFNNDVMLALAAYNAGEGAVMRYGNNVPPFAETQGYVRHVMRYLQRNLRESAAGDA